MDKSPATGPTRAIAQPADTPAMDATIDTGPVEPSATADFRQGPPDRTNAPPAAPEVPAAFGRYQVRRSLGRGGFGTVYLGYDTELDRPVAIKVLRAASTVTKEEREQFVQEARRLAKLRHPGIVAVHDVGMQNEQVFLISDFLDGRDLRQWLKENRPSWQEAVRIVAAVADALAQAHSRLIVHRDIKSANIILTSEGAPVLVDFGLALDESAAGGGEKGIVSGTPAYMSPEQTAGSAHRIDGRTDIYSLGVVLYEMLTGRLPFAGANLKELLRQIRDDEPQPPRQLVQDIPRELERVCLMALAKRHKDRHTTAADFADDLRRTLAPAAKHPAAQPTPQPKPTEPKPPAPPPVAVTPSSSKRRLREAERRQVTILACGIGLFEGEAYLQLEEEDQAKILPAFRQACDEAIRRFDGASVQCNQQGLLACFGFPVAYEDAPHRAARAGLELLDDLKELGAHLRREFKVQMTPWVGLHTGPALAEEKGNTISLIGEARNVAVQMEAVAARGQVICSEFTHGLIWGQFDCVSVGPHKIKGVAQPIELYTIVGVGETRSRVEASAPLGLSPLTGRNHEVSLLKERWEQAQEGMGQVVLVIGEPGLGKSRLVYTLKQHVQGQAGEIATALVSHPSSASAQAAADSNVIEWRCSPHFQNTGLYPASDFFERFLAFGRDEPPAARFERLVSHLAEFDLARPEIVPLFATLLSLPLDERFPALGLPPVREREETFRAMRDWLRAYAEKRSVLFILEDLHWLDASTLEFLGQFLAEGFHDRILTLLTFRPEFETPWPAVAHQSSLALNRLTRRQVGDLMRAKAGRPVPDAFVEQVYDRAGGVPLFVEEFTKSILESGMLDQAGIAGTAAGALLARTIPATLQDLVMARLDRMESEREVAQLGAVLGREFGYELIAAVAAESEAALQAELTKLTEAEILYAKGRPPRCSYIFKHALLQDALYNALVKGKRQSFHRRIAEALEAKFPQTLETQPELLAHHLTEAGCNEKAVVYWLKAGLRSRERSADIEAIGHLTTGRDLLATLPESPERDGQELQILTPLGTAYVVSRGYAAPEVGPVFDRARALCEKLGVTTAQFAVMWGIWVWHLVRGELQLCRDLSQEAVAWAEANGNRGIIMESHHLPAVTMQYRGDFARARDHSAQAIALCNDPEACRFWTIHTGQNSSVTHRCYLFLPLWQLGNLDESLRVNEEAITLARRIAHPFTVAYVLHHTGWLLLQGRFGTQLQVTAEEQIAISAEQGFAFWHASGTFYKGAGLFLQGDVANALPLLEKGIHAWQATGAELTLTYQISTLCEAYTQAGRFSDAHQALARGLALVEKNEERCQEAELYRVKGELLLGESADQSAAAEVCFGQAIETARRQQSRTWELRATLSLARLWRRQSRAAEARAALAAILGAFTQGFKTPDLTDAAAMMESLS